MWPGLLVPPQMRHRWDAVVATHPSQLARLRAPRGRSSLLSLCGARGGAPGHVAWFSPAVWGRPLSLCASGTPKGKETPSGNPEEAECVRHTTLVSSPRGRRRRGWAESCSPASFSSSTPFLSLRQTRGLGWPWILLESRGCWLEHVAPRRDPPRVAGWPAAQSSGEPALSLFGAPLLPGSGNSGSGSGVT